MARSRVQITFVVGGKCRLSWSRPGWQTDLPISVFCIQRRKYRSVGQRGDTPVHAQYRVRVPILYCVRFLVMEAEAKLAIPLWQNPDPWCPIGLSHLHNVLGEHPVDLLFLKFSRIKTGLVQSWIYRTLFWDFEFRFSTVPAQLTRSGHSTYFKILRTFQQTSDDKWHICLTFCISLSNLNLRFGQILLRYYAFPLAPPDAMATCNERDVSS